ncbi:MAG: pseudouridine synthase [Burkholderiales bacterium]|uniref:pseudouridine synthase n=1 Tax=Nitrosomonas sp. TaxID=42353 RepID=UPI001D86ED14|nr:pseudouridine synthase [Nitrosomonas sp.]MCB1949439.1 pseudouridine synthase [Nitrosomonas sp.]MCP5243167.1 pseudouridine synthase [Burkholderiales bacterium]
MARLILFNKPYGVVCQFTAVSGHCSLKDYISLPGFYAAGRLDADSEGLIILTDNGRVQNRISHPKYKLPKTYWVQVEGVPTDMALQQLRRGLKIKDYTTQPAKADLMSAPENLWPRTPPVRFRKHIPTAWITLTIQEGKNRQVRRMTAAVGYPTLRLIRFAIGDYSLNDLAPGCWRLLHIR